MKERSFITFVNESGGDSYGAADLDERARGKQDKNVRMSRRGVMMPELIGAGNTAGLADRCRPS